MSGKHTPLMLLALGAALVATTAARAATPVDGSISGPVIAAKGKTFTVTTPLSPTGSSKVTVTLKTTITTQKAGAAGDVKKGMCVFATGTKKGSAVTASRLTLTRASSRQCGRAPNGAGGGGGPGGAGGGGPGGGRPPGGGSGFSPPANFAFAAGTVTSVKGATVTVKGQQGSTKLILSSKTQISETLDVGASAVKAKLCAFVRGTSSNKGVTITADNIALTKPVSGSCTARRAP